MRLLLIHLSDIHVKGPKEVIFNRRGAIVDAVKNLDYSLDACVIVVTGDIAYAGKEDQLFHAWEFLDALKSDLIEKLRSIEGQSKF